MRNGVSSIVIGLLSLAHAACCTTPKLLGAPKEQLKVADLVEAIQRAVQPVWDGGTTGVPFNNVTITLQTVNDNKFSVEGDYLIVALKGYYDQAKTNQLSVKLVTAPQLPVGLRAESETEAITAELKAMIENAQQGIKKSYGTGKYELDTNEIDLQIQFQVTWDVSAGVNKWAILPVSLTASDEYSSKTMHSITVAFVVPKKPA